MLLACGSYVAAIYQNWQNMTNHPKPLPHAQLAAAAAAAGDENHPETMSFGLCFWCFDAIPCAFYVCGFNIWVLTEPY